MNNEAGQREQGSCGGAAAAVNGPGGAAAPRRGDLGGQRVGPPIGRYDPGVQLVLTLGEAVSYLGISKRFLYGEIRSGALPALLVAGTYWLRQREVDAYLEQPRVAGDASGALP